MLNEVLDTETDKKHPVQCNRPVSSCGLVNIKIAYIEWLLSDHAGMAGIWDKGGGTFFASAATVWTMGCLFNIKLIITKYIPYLDVISGSVNNPLRLLLGWHATGTTLILPLPLRFGYCIISTFYWQ